MLTNEHRNVISYNPTRMVTASSFIWIVWQLIWIVRLDEISEEAEIMNEL